MRFTIVRVACWIACTLLCAPELGQAQEASSNRSDDKSARLSEPCTQSRTAATAADAELVELNSADAEDLERLPGIGPSRARAILELRARMKRFTRVEDLMRVRGIGRATFRKLRPLIRLDAS
jgi:competence protein ComEA